MGEQLTVVPGGESDVEAAVVAGEGRVQGDDKLCLQPVLPHLQAAGGDRDAGGDGWPTDAIHLAHGHLAQVQVVSQGQEVVVSRVRQDCLHQFSLF